MRRILRSRKQNNGGMSLIEVVVAIAILSIAILPILYTFVYSTRYNAQARVKQQTMAAAQTVMENFKAYSVQEICDQFDAETFAVSTGPSTNMSCSGYSEDNPDNPIDFYITGMLYQDAEYNVEIKLTPHDSLAASVDTLIYETRLPENSVAIAIQNQAMDVKALEQIMGKVAEKWTIEENLAMPGLETPVTHYANEVDRDKIKITRSLNVDISKVDANYVAKVSCEYAYVVASYPYQTSEDGSTTSHFSMSDTYIMDPVDMLGAGAPADGVIFNQPLPVSTPVPGATPEPAPASPVLHLTLCYFPAYSYGSGSPVEMDTDSDGCSDNITIKNNTDAEVKCYIYKQKNRNASDPQLATSESTYKVKLNLKNASVYDDNLNVWFGKENDLSVPRPFLTDDKIKVVAELGDGSRRYHGIGYTSVQVTYPSTSSPSPVMPLESQSELISKTIKDVRRMYDISIFVFSKDGTTLLNELKGTIVE